MKELQNKINMLLARNGKMCKDKWNILNLYFKENCKLSQGDKSQYFFLKASNVSKNDKLNLPRQFNQNYYEAI